MQTEMRFAAHEYRRLSQPGSSGCEHHRRGRMAVDNHRGETALCYLPPNLGHQHREEAGRFSSAISTAHEPRLIAAQQINIPLDVLFEIAINRTADRKIRKIYGYYRKVMVATEL
jgi:hypothetical protein